MLDGAPLEPDDRPVDDDVRREVAFAAQRARDDVVAETDERDAEERAMHAELQRFATAGVEEGHRAFGCVA